MTYTTNETIEPFWAEFSSAASGRDPLAIQNSSVVIYAKMVIGITNVTNRIRYNGFYCWIFDTILKNIKKKNSLHEQMKYSRRAELLLAYIMVHNFHDITGVSGSDYASKNMTTTINLKKGADWEFKQKGERVYWQASQGIFGQYYSGVTSTLNLINHPNPHVELNVYTLTEKGQELAKYFSENIPLKEQKLFWEAVYNGKINEGDLAELKSFAMHKIPSQSNELNFYEQMLISADDKKAEPTFNRRNTIMLLLDYLNNEKDGVENPVSSFLRSNYFVHINEQQLQKDTGTAWYLFEINELLHVAYEHFHASFLYSIETFPTVIDTHIEELVNDTKQSLEETPSTASANTINDLLKLMRKERKEVYLFYAEMEKSFKSGEYGKCLMNAIKTIICVYLNSEKHIEQLEEFAAVPEYNLNRSGYAIELFNELVSSYRELTISEYVKAVLLKAINKHTFSSYSKTRIGQSLVHNYMIEDYFVWRLRETLPSRTTPRLQNVLQYILDIGWIKKEKKKFSITESGIKTLEGK